jgi:hypothetical protein
LHLSYWPIILSCAFNTNIQKIIKIQKKAIHIISNKPWNSEYFHMIY